MLVLSPDDSSIPPEFLPVEVVEGRSVSTHVREQVLSGKISLSDAVDDIKTWLDNGKPNQPLERQHNCL